MKVTQLIPFVVQFKQCFENSKYILLVAQIRRTESIDRGRFRCTNRTIGRISHCSVSQTQTLSWEYLKGSDPCGGMARLPTPPSEHRPPMLGALPNHRLSSPTTFN